VVQERLGHANIAITLDTYSDVIAGLHEDAAEQVAALFRTPVSNPLAEGQRAGVDVSLG
jgi:integrase